MQDDWDPTLQKSKAYEQLLVDIIMGVLPPGQPVDEKALSARYSMGLAAAIAARDPVAAEQAMGRLVGDPPSAYLGKARPQPPAEAFATDAVGV